MAISGDEKMTVSGTETTGIEGSAHTRGDLARGRLSLPEVIAQSIGTVAPSGTPALVIPVVFAVAGNATC